LATVSKSLTSSSEVHGRRVVDARARRGEVAELLADEMGEVSGYGDGDGGGAREVLIPLLVGVLGVRGMVAGDGMSAGDEDAARMAVKVD
jgi:hypothetical protein